MFLDKTGNARSARPTIAGERSIIFARGVLASGGSPVLLTWVYIHVGTWRGGNFPRRFRIEDRRPRSVPQGTCARSLRAWQLSCQPASRFWENAQHVWYRGDVFGAGGDSGRHPRARDPPT